MQNLQSAPQVQNPVDPLAPVNTDTKPLGKKIEDLCKKALHHLSGGRLYGRPPLSKESVEAITQFKWNKVHVYPLQPKRVDRLKFNTSLEAMRSFTKKFVGLAVDCIQETYIDPELQGLKKNPNKVTNYLSTISKEAISIGLLSFDTIRDAMKEYGPATAKIHELVNDWALKKIQPNFDTFKEKLKNRLNKQVTDGVIKVDMTHFDDFSNRILDWLFNSNHEQNIRDIFPDISDNKLLEETIPGIFQGALHLLIEETIEIYKADAVKLLEKKLPKLIKALIKQNAVKTVDYLSKQLANVIDNMGDEQFIVLFDQIIAVAGKHVIQIADSYEAADQAENEYEDLQKDLDRMRALPPKNEQETATLAHCEAYIQTLGKRDGMQGAHETELQRTFLKLTGNLSISVDNHATKNMSQLILDILLPPLIKDGKTVSGLEDLLSTLEFPQEFKDLYNEAQTGLQKNLTAEQYKPFEKLKDTVFQFKGLALDKAPLLMKFGLNLAIEKLVGHLSKPEEIYTLLANEILPSVTANLIGAFADDLIQHNLSEIAPHLHDLATEYNEQKEKNLLDLLLKLAKDKSSQFEFSKKNFHSNVKSRINELVNLIKRVREQDAARDQLQDTTLILKENYKSTSSKDNNPHFADFIEGFLRTGKFGSFLPQLFQLSSVKNSISTMLTNAMGNLRKSSRPLINMTVDSLEKSFSKKKDIQDKLFKEAPKKPTSEAPEKPVSESPEKPVSEAPEKPSSERSYKKKLPLQIQRLSKIAYDVLLYKTKKSVPLLGSFFFKQFLGSDANSLAHAITSFVNRIFARRAFNEYLMNKILQTSLTALHMTTEAPRTTRHLLKPDNQAKLEQINVPVSAEAFHENPEFVAPPKKPLELKISLWRRIANFFINFFKKIKLWFTPKKIVLNQHQLNLMDAVKGNFKMSRDPINHTVEAVENTNDVHPNVEKAEEVRQNVIYKPSVPTLHSSLVKTGTVVTNFMQNLAKELYDKKVSPLLTPIKDFAKDIPKFITPLLNLVTKIFSQQNDTVIRKILLNGYKLEPDTHSKGFFYLLFKNLKDKNNRLRPEIEKELLSGYQKLKYENRIDVKSFSKSIFEWISKDYPNYNSIQPLANFVPDKLTSVDDFETIIAKFYESTIETLVKFQIENQANDLQKYLEDGLHGDVEKFLTNNFSHFSNLLFNRVAELLNRVSSEEYKNRFDDILRDVHNQMNTLISANEAAAKKPLVDQQEQILQELIVNPTVPSLAKSLFKSTADGKVVEKNAVFIRLANHLMEILFPIQEGTDGIEELLENIIAPQFVKILQEKLQFIKSLLPKKANDITESIQAQVIKILKKFLIDIAREKISKLLAKQLREVFTNIADEKKRKKLIISSLDGCNFQVVRVLTNQYLPDPKETLEFYNTFIQEESLSDIWIQKEIYSHCQSHWIKLGVTPENFKNEHLPHILAGYNRSVLKTVISHVPTGLFRTYMVKPNNPESYNEIRKTLLENLNLQHMGNTQVFDSYLKPLLETISTELMEKQKVMQQNDPSASLHDNDIHSTINIIFNGENDQQYLYVDMLQSLIKMGNFGGKLGGSIQKVLSWQGSILGIVKVKRSARDVLTNIFLPALYPVRSAVPSLVEVIRPSLERKLNADYAMTIFAAPQEIPKEESPELLEDKFNHSLKCTSHLLYDLIKSGMDSAGYGYAWTQAAGSDSTHMFEALHGFHEKFFYNNDLNEALFVEAIDKVIGLVKPIV